MFGIEKAYADAIIRALRTAQRALFDTLVSDAISRSHVLHKGDTLGLDQRPENAITSALQKFDPHCIIITEERGAVNPFAIEGPTSLQGARTFFGCDPFDRSNQACDFFKKHGNQAEKIVDVIRRSNICELWEKEFGGPVSISSSTSAISCIRRGLPIATVILNHFTEEMTLACAAGIYHVKLPKDLALPVTLDYVQQNGVQLAFPQPDYNAGQKIVAFIGKPDRGYPSNFANCRLVMDTQLDKHLHYGLPGGPSRVLYLSNLQPDTTPIGVVVANGEKIGEWIHWLTFTRFAYRLDDRSAPALRLFEVSQNQSLMIDGYLMMPSPDYSIFTNYEHRGRVLVSSDKLQSLVNPSKYRSTLVLIPANNKWALSQVEQYGYREIIF
ncbi:MAG TPA: hypothetical protein VJI96_00525 [Candidatus Andersenbacteria bacterium]|nr:hypothetical protein [Candidatus Andersenbacteria bacterium]